MGVSSSVSTAVDALKRNPVVFVAAFAVAVVGLGVLTVALFVAPFEEVYWSAASLGSQLVSLFFIGGAYGMAAESLRGETRLATLVSEGRDNYLSLVGATLVLFAIVIAVSFVIGIAVFAVVFVASASLGPDAFGALLVLLVGSYLLGAVPLFFLQFYGPAVVVPGDGAVDSLKRSLRLVRRNLLATLGFDAVLLAVTLVATAPTVWLYVTRWNSFSAAFGGTTPTRPEPVSSFASLDPATAGAYLLASLVLATLSGGFVYAYQVAFYDDRLNALSDG